MSARFSVCCQHFNVLGNKRYFLNALEDWRKWHYKTRGVSAAVGWAIKSSIVACLYRPQSVDTLRCYEMANWIYTLL